MEISVNAYDSLGDYQKAIEYHEKHLKIAKEIGDRAGEGGAYGNLGNAYSVMLTHWVTIKKPNHEKHLPVIGPEKEELMEYHEKKPSSLKIAKEIGDRAGEGRA